MAKKDEEEEKEEEQKNGKKPKKRGFLRALFRFIFKLIMFTVVSTLILAVIIGVGAYFMYDSYTIKTFTLCVNNTPTETPYSCASDSECVNTLVSNPQNQMPDAMKNLMKNFMSEFIKCRNNMCQMRFPRGFDQPVTECLPSEEKREMKITLKQILPPDQIIPTIKQFISTGKMPFQQ